MLQPTSGLLQGIKCFFIFDELGVRMCWFRGVCVRPTVISAYGFGVVI